MVLEVDWYRRGRWYGNGDRKEGGSRLGKLEEMLRGTVGQEDVSKAEGRVYIQNSDQASNDMGYNEETRKTD